MTKNDEFVDALHSDPMPDPPPPKVDDFLSTGSTLLNLACTGDPFRGFCRGKYYFIVGDSASGKTFLAVSCMAEATMNAAFSEFRLIYDNVEDGMLLDVERLFNKQLADRIEPPHTDKDGTSCYSATIEEFYYHLDDAVQAGKPFIYVLDSMDALTSAAEESKFEETKTAHRKGKTTTGSYGDGKAKVNSANIRKVMKGVREMGSILIILAQTRDNLGFGFEKKTRSGGRALKFYATIEIWTAIKSQIKKTIKGKQRPIGVLVQLRLRKNRVTGLTPEVYIPIYPSFGIDDTASVVDYLIDEGWWRVKGKMVQAKEVKIEAAKGDLPRLIEQKGRVRRMRLAAGKCWQSIMDAAAMNDRFNRYRISDE
jgi:RecA/RadA recombinase